MRRSFPRKRQLNFEALEARQVLDSTVVFSELLYHPADDNESLEWIEFYNQMAIDMDLSGWTVEGGIDFTFPAGTVLGGGEYLVLAADPAALLSATGVAADVGPYTGRLVNSGETVSLVNNSGRLMDEIEYSDSGVWPVGPDGSGTTLAKQNKFAASGPAENWISSLEVGGTPGEENFEVEVITRLSADIVQQQTPASILIPANNNVGNAWLAPGYNQGSLGETWTSGTTNVGFAITSSAANYANAVLPDNPLVYWRLNETSAAGGANNLGLIGNPGDATYNAGVGFNAPSLIEETGDRSISLAGLTTAAVTSPGFEKLAANGSIGGTGKTIEFWFVADTLPTALVNLVGDAETSTDLSHSISLTETGRIRSSVRTRSGFLTRTNSVDSDRVIQPGEVVHVVSTWNASSGIVTLYLNGQPTTFTTSSGAHPTVGALQNTTNPVFVGRDGQTTASLNGRVDEVAIYNYPLAGDRVAAHYGAAQPTFSSQIDTNIRTAMHNINASAYVRIPFNVPTTIAVDQLNLAMRYDDGFIAYLNGTEVARRNAPAALTFNSAATADRPLADVLITETINLNAHLGLLQPTGNLLAIHGLNASASNSDFLLAPILSVAGNSIPAGKPPAVRIHEVASALDANFRIELKNDGEAPIDLNSFVLTLDRAVPVNYVFPATQIAPGGYLVLTATTLGFTPASGDRFFLYTPNKLQLLDAREVTNRLRGRAEEFENRWLYPSVATFGSANNFNVEHDVVINEIMYNAQPQYASQATISSTTLIPSNANWSYTGPAGGLDGQSPAWQAPSYNDTSWSSGPGSFGNATNPVDYAQTVLQAQPLGYWRLGEATGTAINDASGNGRHGTANAGVVLDKPSLIGGSDGAANPSGTNRITIPAFEKFPAGSTGFTVEYWIKLNAAPSLYNIVGDGESGGDYYLMNYMLANGAIRPHYSAANSPVSMDSVQTLQPGRVYHVVTTWDRSAGIGRIYIDGQLDSSASTTTNAPANTNNVLFLGKDDREPAGNFDLDEVALYNRPLSASEVASHFQAGVGAGFTTAVPLGPTTHYFRNDFVFSGNAAETELTLRTAVDDGAVYYLNGVEIYRHNMPTGAVTHTTLASTEVESATVVSEVAIPSSALIVGTNVLAVEVHQALPANDPDMNFSAELIATTRQGLEQPYLESDEEWIELFNRGTTPINLSNWQLNDGIAFDFPAGTTIGPGEYLLIANDATQLALLYPESASRIVGSFSGTLSNSHERIELTDAAGNPADEVAYFDNGQWAAFADGGGSSLELRDPFADNSNGAAWDASDQGALSDWRTYTYRGIAANPPGSNNPSTYNEFSFGLLDAGELLIDDIHVIENPRGAATEFLQNSTFASGLTSWRPVGTQHGTVVPDPDDPTNNVFHLTATDNEEHLQNHVETTLKSGTVFENIQLGTEYEISFRAKWLGGSPQLNTRLFFNLLPRTTILDTTPGGTPGRSNSTHSDNIGPTYAGFRHSPVIPTAGQDIAVFATPSDDDPITAMTLWYAVGGGPWLSHSMGLADGGEYLGVIPGQAAGSIIQFYVEGQDSQGASSTFPALGRDARALVAVGQGATSTTGLHNVRILTTAADEARLGASTNLMSNDSVGATVIYQGEVFYDVGVRLKGSEHGRADVNRRGLNLSFPTEQLFRGVHSSVSIDRSGGWRFGTSFGQDEMLIHQFFNHAGDVPSMFNDLAFVDGPSIPDGTAILQLARFNDEFLDTQFDNGSEGTNYEYELIYTMLTSGGVESLKTAQEGPSVFGIPVGRNMGDDKEAYRHYFLIKNNRDEDTYDGMIALAKAFALSGDAFHAETAEVLDLDQWMRAFAAQTLTGAGDNYHSGAQHNAHFYQRPSDGKMLYFPFDMDFAFTGTTNAPLSQNGDLTKLLTSPNNLHAFLGHVQDIITTSFNTAYMDDWTTHYSTLLPGQNFSSILTWIGQRNAFVQSQLPAQTTFSATGQPSVVNSQTLVASNAPAKAIIPSVANGGSALGTTWTAPNFVEPASWVAGQTGVGYETSVADYAGLVQLDVAGMFGQNGSVFTRIPFQFNGDAAALDRMVLRMKYDDGFVAYLNGTRIAAANAPTTPTWNSLATASHADTDAVNFSDFDVSQFRNLLVQGNNVLAIQGLNATLDSSDLLILPELIVEDIAEGNSEINVNTPTAVVSGRGWVNVRDIYLRGAVEPLDVTWTSATAWQATIPVAFGTHDVTFDAFDFQGQPIGSATLSVTSSANNPVDVLRIAEINYNPIPPTAAELAALPGVTNNDFEFIEIENTGTAPVGLNGFRITDGVDFTFPDVQLGAGQRAVVVQDQVAFNLRYGSSNANVLGTFTSGRLNNDGERLTLVDVGGSIVLSFVYDDDGLWPEGPDGTSGTLQWIAPSNTPIDQQEKFYHWQGSTTPLGSPGSANLPRSGITITEIVLPSELAGTTYGAIELRNTSTLPFDLSNAWISDSDTNLQKFRIPSLPPLDPGQYIVFDTTDFLTNPAVGTPSGMVLNAERGGELWLTRDGAVLDQITYGAVAGGATWGRLHANGGPAIIMSRPTLGGDNAIPQAGRIAFSEVHFNPAAPNSAALAANPNVTADDLEFVEIQNSTLASVDLTGWQVRGGITHDFVNGQSLPAGQSLVLLTFDPSAPSNASLVAAFRAQYGMGANVLLAGGYSGQLDDDLDTIELLRPTPAPASAPTLIPMVAEDVVTYDDIAPWPLAADGLGSSLHRKSLTALGSRGGSWLGNVPTPGQVSFAGQLLGDFSGNGQLDGADIEVLRDAIRDSRYSSQLDLNANGTLEQADIDHFVSTVARSFPGDANLDRQLNGTDLAIWSVNAFQQSLGISRSYRSLSGGATPTDDTYYHLGSWDRADFNGDNLVDGTDFNVWNNNKFRVAAPAASPVVSARVPRAPLTQGNAATLVDQVIGQRSSILLQQANRARRIGGHTFAQPIRSTIPVNTFVSPQESINQRAVDDALGNW